MPEEIMSEGGQDPGPIETGPVDNLVPFDPGPIELGDVVTGPPPGESHPGEAAGHGPPGGE